MDDSGSQLRGSEPAERTEALDRLRRGDPAFLRQLLEDHLPSLCHYAEGILRGSGDPQEVVQEAFIRLWTHRERWRGDGTLRSLLFTITRNAALDELRRHKRETHLSDHHLDAIPALAPSPLDRLVEADLREAAARAIASLPPRRQEIFRLVREGGLSYREVAQVLEISPQTVANLMSLALGDLRQALGPTLDSSLHASGSD